MEQKSDRIHPSAPLLEKSDLEQRLEKKLNDVDSFINHISNIKETITYFNEKIYKSKKKYQKSKTLATKLKSFDTFAVTATISSPITLSFTGLTAVPKPIATACGFSIGIKVLYEIILEMYNLYKELYERD